MKKIILFYLWLICCTLNNWKIYTFSLIILATVLLDAHFIHKSLFILYFILMLITTTLDVNWIRQDSLTRYKILKMYKQYAFKI